MGFESDFLGLMADTVQIRTHSGDDQYGQPEYGAPVSRVCRVVFKPEMLRAADGRELKSTARIYMSGDFGTTPKDKVIMSDGTEVIIQEVRSYPDDLGTHHEVIMV